MARALSESALFARLIRSVTRQTRVLCFLSTVSLYARRDARPPDMAPKEDKPVDPSQRTMCVLSAV